MIRIHGIGRLYWGIERELVDKRWVTPAWLVEDSPPYRRSSHGCRIRFAPDQALHLGLCHRSLAPHKEMPQYSPTQIGKWGKDGVSAEDDSGRAFPEPIRPVADRGPDQPHRGRDDQVRGTFPRAIP
jgi:hypothetical protein